MQPKIASLLMNAFADSDEEDEQDADLSPFLEDWAILFSIRFFGRYTPSERQFDPTAQKPADSS
jgi:hypothetical protein